MLATVQDWALLLVCIAVWEPLPGWPVRMREERRAMATFVTILLIALGITALVGGIVAYIASRRAPGGFEDDQGFHHTERPDRSKRR